MRDPAGRINFVGDFVIRNLNHPADTNHFLYSELAKRWVESGSLISYEWLDAKTLRSPRMPFVTLPSEWTYQHFYRAAQFTLQLQAEAVEEGWDLKDASAWNIVFNGINPVFVDLLSFVSLHERLWRAAGQFNRHFLLPLLIGKKGLMEPRQCMTLWRDGVQPKSASELLGLGRFVTRYWPLMTTGVNQSILPRIKISNYNKNELTATKAFRANIHTTLNWMIDGLSPNSHNERPSIWGEYERDRRHYTMLALEFKRETISRWLHILQPEWILDLGCNAGEFAELAIKTGAKAICWDADPQALSTLWQRHSQKQTAVQCFPILCPIDDATGGSGWMGSEYPSLLNRLNQRCDVVMLLAVTHHLAIAGGVRLDDIFLFASKISRRAILLELLSEKDSRVIELCHHFNRDPAEFSVQKQLAAAKAAGFYPVQHSKRSLEDTREYIWMEHEPLACQIK